MELEQLDLILSELDDPTTAPVLAQALGYRSNNSITHACEDGRIPEAKKAGGIWLIPLDGVRQAIQQKTLRPRG